LAGEESGLASGFSYESLERLTEACVDFYRKSLEKADLSDARQRRKQLSKHVRKFHADCGTLSPHVEEAIKRLEDGSCLLLMTAHQPNLFAYSGVLRKATLNHVLEKRLSKDLEMPVVSFFGVADQDFADDRWVRSAFLPDVERRNGLLELRFDMSEKLMLNRVSKPSRRILDDWQNRIQDWMNRKLSSIERHRRALGDKSGGENADLAGNLQSFWKLVEDAYNRAETYADFSAYIMSRIVNEIWGYDTLFSRFSECQQIFEREFCFLLSRFDEYSCYVKEARLHSGSVERGVYEQEFDTVPFWYHCDCGSKARLTPGQRGGSYVGHGQCLRCGKEYEIDFQSKDKPRISDFVSKISARSLSMPLVFFHGLRAGCYVGGVGGSDYLEQAKYVAQRLCMNFPPAVVWRPKDVYLGIGQLDALMTFRDISGTFDFSLYARVEDDLRRRIAEVQGKIDELEEEKKKICASSGEKTEEQVRDLKVLSARQCDLRRGVNFPVLMRNLGLLENVAVVMDLYPCIVDYAVNVGLKETSEQWIAFLQGNGNLSSNVSLRTGFDDLGADARSGFAR
jgi:hypothetical protein